MLLYNSKLGKRPGKLKLRYMGPFQIAEEVGQSTYLLADTEGRIFPKSVNGYRLKPYLTEESSVKNKNHDVSLQENFSSEVNLIMTHQSNQPDPEFESSLKQEHLPLIFISAIRILYFLSRACVFYLVPATMSKKLTVFESPEESPSTLETRKPRTRW